MSSKSDDAPLRYVQFERMGVPCYPLCVRKLIVAVAKLGVQIFSLIVKKGRFSFSLGLKRDMF